MYVIKHIYRICCLVILLQASSCNDFLEVKPKGTLIPEKIIDYERILLSAEVTSYHPFALFYASDDYYDRLDAVNVSVPANAFYWRADLDPTDLVEPAIWGPCYRAIYHYNIIINDVMDAQDGTLAQKQQLVAEAKVGRSWAYFYLLTAFSKAYDPQTAAEDPGVPLVSSTDVTDAVPPRASLQEVMDLITGDVLASIDVLPVVNQNNFRASKKAAYGLLARVYLYKGNYLEAERYGTLAMEETHALLNLNQYANMGALPRVDLNPESVWTQGTNVFAPRLMQFADDIIALYGGPMDQRFRLYTTPTVQGRRQFMGTGSGIADVGITFPEMYLTVAEAMARRGEVEGALDLVNTIRTHRIHPDSYAPKTAASDEEALRIVLDERRVELAFRGTRWMDMKRLDREGRMPEVRRVDAGTGEVLATLSAGSKAYTFQIPLRVQLFNPTMILNDR